MYIIENCVIFIILYLYIFFFFVIQTSEKSVRKIILPLIYKILYIYIL